MALTDIERITEFESRFAKAQATEVVDLSWGFAVLQADFPLSHYHNRVVVTAPAAASDILQTAEELLDNAGARHRYVSVDDDSLGQALSAEFKAAGYELDQLADRTVLYARGAQTILLAVSDGEQIAAHATLHLDRPRSLAQFENLVTGQDFRGRGYGNALVRDALRRSHEAGCDLSFLTAGVSDWPHAWYQRLGYLEVGRTHHFSRQP